MLSARAAVKYIVQYVFLTRENITYFLVDVSSAHVAVVVVQTCWRAARLPVK